MVTAEEDTAKTSERPHAALGVAEALQPPEQWDRTDLTGTGHRLHWRSLGIARDCEQQSAPILVGLAWQLVSEPRYH